MSLTCRAPFQLDSREQLKNIAAIKVYNYKYKDDFAEYAGLSDEDTKDTGVLAQEVSQVLPDAVKDTGSIVLPDGEKVPNFMVVNKVNGAFLRYTLLFWEWIYAQFISWVLENAVISLTWSNVSSFVFGHVWLYFVIWMYSHLVMLTIARNASSWRMLGLCGSCAKWRTSWNSASTRWSIWAKSCPRSALVGTAASSPLAAHSPSPAVAHSGQVPQVSSPLLLLRKNWSRNRLSTFRLMENILCPLWIPLHQYHATYLEHIDRDVISQF